MGIAKLFENGENQVVQLPDDCRLTGDEVYIQKLGHTIILTPKEDVWQVFMSGISCFTEDYFENGREKEVVTVRVY